MTRWIYSRDLNIIAQQRCTADVCITAYRIPHTLSTLCSPNNRFFLCQVHLLKQHWTWGIGAGQKQINANFIKNQSLRHLNCRKLHLIFLPSFYIIILDHTSVMTCKSYFPCMCYSQGLGESCA